MKTIKLLTLFLCLGILQSCCVNGNCDEDDFVAEPDFSESRYEPAVLSRADLEESVKLLPPKPIVNSGKIYVLNSLLFVNEKDEGFHVFQNEDPSNPTPLNFIEIPGSTDVSIRNGIYYVNQAVDLIAISFEARQSELNVSKRIREVFPVKISPDGYYPNVAQDSVVVGWKLKTQG